MSDPTHDEDVRLVRDTPLTPDERVAMWRVARRLGRTRDEDVLLNALYHDHADCAAGRGLSPGYDALMEEHRTSREFEAIEDEFQEACKGYDTKLLHRLEAERNQALAEWRAAHDKVEKALTNGTN